MENAIPAVVIAGLLITAAALLGHATNRSVDNVGGFLELAHGTIRNYQRERFEKRESQEVARH